MGLLNDTITDALRPLPAGGVVRRSHHHGAVPSSEDIDPDAGNGAITVYRLQKDGGHVPPAAPTPKPATTEGQGPSNSARGSIPDAEGAAAVPDRKLDRNLRGGEQRNEDKGNEWRFVADEGSVSKVPLRSTSSRHRVVSSSYVPEAQVADVVMRNSESGTSGRTDELVERRSAALGAPSEDLSPRGRDASSVATAAIDAPRPADGVLPERRRDTPVIADRGAAAFPTAPGDVHADIARLAQAVVEQTRAAPAGMRVGQSEQARVATAERRAAPVAATELARAPMHMPVPVPARAPATANAPPAPPRVHIGHLDVTVLAPAPSAPARAARDKGPASSSDFLSRNYLRRG